MRFVGRGYWLVDLQSAPVDARFAPLAELRSRHLCLIELPLLSLTLSFAYRLSNVYLRRFVLFARLDLQFAKRFAPYSRRLQHYSPIAGRCWRSLRFDALLGYWCRSS